MPIKLNLNQITENALRIGNGGGQVRQVNTDEIELVNAAGAAYTKGYAETPVALDPANTIATKGYVDALVAGPQMSAILTDPIVGNGTKSSTVSLPVTAWIARVRLLVSTPFDGTPLVDVQDAGPTLIASFTTAELGTVGLYEVGILFNVGSPGPIDIVTSSFGTVGAARVWIEYANDPDIAS